MTYTILIFDDLPGQDGTVTQAISRRLGYRIVTSDTVDYGINWLMSGIQPQPDLIVIACSTTPKT